MRYFYFLLFGLLTLNVFSQEKRTFLEDENRVPAERFVDMKHLKLEVSFEPEAGLVKGKVTHLFQPIREKVDSIILDAINMDIQSVMMGKDTLIYNYDKKYLTLYFPSSLNWKQQYSIQINYEATPKKGLYFIGWNDPLNKSRKQIWSQGQGIDNRHWIPMFDDMSDKIISEMIVKMPEKYKVLSNGKKLKEKSLKGDIKEWHYEISHPHAPYLIMLGIGDYAIEKRKSASGVPINLYYYPDEKEKVEPTYRYSVPMFDLFEKTFGVAYPWESYSQIPVQDFMYGAMENTTATIFGDFYLVNNREFIDRNYVRVDAHELAHQWFGDMVTARTSTHAWLQESFATHFDMTYQREAFGQDYFDWVRRGYNNQSLNASKNDLKPIAHSAAGTVRHYPKGALVLNMLKYVVGEKQFNSTLQYYLTKHAYGTVDTEDFLIAFQENLGMSLDWFWEEWILKGGEPAYQVNFEELENYYRFKVKQIHETNDLVGLFKMPIQFEVHFTDNTSISITEWIENESQEVNIKKVDGKTISYALFDPNSQILKNIQFNKSELMLRNQLANAENMMDRYDALVALKGKLSTNELMQVFQKESFHAIKSEAIEQAILFHYNEVDEFLRLALKDEDAEVLKTVLKNTFSISSANLDYYKPLLADSSYEVIEKTLDLLCFHHSDKADEFLEITKGVQGNRAHNVAIKWLEWSYLSTYDQKYVDSLVQYASISYEFLTRSNAAKALERLNYLNVPAVEHLLDGIFSGNSRMRGAANSALAHFHDQTAYAQLIRAVILSKTWTDDEFRTLNKYLIY